MHNTHIGMYHKSKIVRQINKIKMISLIVRLVSSVWAPEWTVIEWTDTDALSDFFDAQQCRTQVLKLDTRLPAAPLRLPL